MAPWLGSDTGVMMEDNFRDFMFKRLLKLPNDVRCTRCKGRGVRLETDLTAPSCLVYNPCMQCVGTGLTTICSAEVIKDRRTD